MRTAQLTRKTNETDITVQLNLDGGGVRNINTGIGFFDHMLELFSAHSGIDLTLTCVGDLKVDGHHTVEDAGITLGKCLQSALGDKCGIRRYGNFLLPMDETLAEVAIDLSGRAFLVFNANLCGESSGFDFALVEEFFRALSQSAGITLHVNVRYGNNLHHIAEAVFKGFARALKAAIEVVGTQIPSSKGTLE